MKKHNFPLWLLSIPTLLSAPTLASADEMFNFRYIRPYLGIDYQERHMGFEDAFGGNIFKKNLPQYDIFGGIRICKYLGINIGYEQTENRNRTETLNVGDTYLGLTILPGDTSETHYTETKVKGTHIDLMGFYPICPRYHIELFGSVGFVRNELELTDITTALDGVIAANPLVRTYDEKRTDARLSLGIQQTFIDHIGIRASVAWEDTSRFNDLKPQEVPNAATEVRAHGSFNYGVGVFIIM